MNATITFQKWIVGERITGSIYSETMSRTRAGAIKQYLSLFGWTDPGKWKEWSPRLGLTVLKYDVTVTVAVTGKKTNQGVRGGTGGEVMSSLFRFDADSWCVVYCRQHSAVVQMCSNIADEKCAKQYADMVRNAGGHVFAAVKAGELIAAMELIKTTSRA